MWSNPAVQYAADEIEPVLELVLLTSVSLGSLHQRVGGRGLVLNAEFDESCNSPEVPEVEDRVCLTNVDQVGRYWS